jgi:hypothetical protein
MLATKFHTHTNQQAVSPLKIKIPSKNMHEKTTNAPQLSISQKALGTLPEDGNVMPKHVGATMHN